MTLTHDPALDDIAPTRASTLHSALWAMLGAGGRYLLAGVTTLTLTHLLAPADFGLIAITALAQLLIEYVLTTGFQDALIQRPALTPAALDSAFWSVTGVTGAAALLVTVLAQPLARWFAHPDLAPLLIGMAAAALLRALSTVPRALLHRRMAFRTVSLIRIAGLVFAGTGAIMLAAAGAGAWSLIAHAALLNGTTTLLIFRAAGYRPTRALSGPALRELWRFAPTVTLFTALSTIIANADDQIVGFELGADALGYYSLAYAFMAWPVYDVLGGIAVVLYPVVSRQQHDLKRLHATYYESLQLATLFAFPILALMAITAPVLIPWLLGPAWQPMIVTVQILAVGGLRSATGMLNGPVYRALGLPHAHTALELASLPCYLTAFVIGVRSGIEGVALLLTVTGLLLQPLSWLLLYRAAGITLRRWLAAILPASGGTLLIVLVTIPVLHLTAYNITLSTPLRLLAAASTAASVYGGFLALVRPEALKRVIVTGLGMLRQSA